jgi:DNA-binding NarL/FixJ family response regulator
MLKLTPRDRQVCEALLEGKSNREIGIALGIHEQSVKARLGHIYLANQIETFAKIPRIVLAVRYHQEKEFQATSAAGQLLSAS